MCLHQLLSKLHNSFSTKSPALQYTYANAAPVFETVLSKMMFRFWNHFLTADFTSSIALPSVLLYSHQHADHHQRLAFVCEFQLEEISRG